MAVLLLKILGAVGALCLGLYLGWPSRYQVDDEELNEALGPGGYTRRVKRRFTLFGWLRKTDERSSHIRRRNRGSTTGRFKLVPPKPIDKK